MTSSRSATAYKPPETRRNQRVTQTKEAREKQFVFPARTTGQEPTTNNTPLRDEDNEKGSKK